MLLLMRRINESIRVNHEVLITVKDIKSDFVTFVIEDIVEQTHKESVTDEESNL